MPSQKQNLKDDLNILVFHSSGVDLFLRGSMRCEIYVLERESGFDFEVTKITRIVSLDK